MPSEHFKNRPFGRFFDFVGKGAGVQRSVLSFLHTGPAQTFVCVGVVQAGTGTLNPYLKTPLKICVPHAQIMYRLDKNKKMTTYTMVGQ